MSRLFGHQKVTLCKTLQKNGPGVFTRCKCYQYCTFMNWRCVTCAQRSSDCTIISTWPRFQCWLGGGVRDSGSRSANWWIIETIRTFHFGVTKVRIDELMNFLTQCELMNWWNDELMNWWIIEWQLMNWWIDELLEDELMNYWGTNWWIDELLIDELMNY